MQKKIIALALAGLASSAAFAQSNVTIYGRADYGFMSRSGNDGLVTGVDRTNEFGSGLQAGSRIGFKGAEDLGNGLKAIFEYEFGLGADVNTGLNSTRHAYVGLTGGFGTLVGGRLDGVRYGIFNKYDAFGGGNMGNFTQMTAQVDRANNAIAYISPTFAGFNAVLAYATHIGNSNPLALGAQENAGNDGDAQLNTVMVGYNNGPISISADWERVSFNSKGAGTAAVVDDVTVMTLGGSYDFGVVKLAALYDNLQVEGRNSTGTLSDVDTWFVSASAPIGKFVAKATYGVTEDDEVSSSKGKKFGIGGQYNLSKRTNVYATYGNISNQSNAGYAISPAANSQGAGIGTKGFDIGVAHNF